MTAHDFTELVLGYPISANRYWASYVPKGKSRAITYVTDEAKAYRRDCQVRAMLAGIRKPLMGRIELHLDLYPRRPKDWAKRAAKDPDYWDDDVLCIDLGNCEKITSDALNGIAWTDDKNIRRMVKNRHAPDDHGARLVVRFRELIPTPMGPTNAGSMT